MASPIHEIIDVKFFYLFVLSFTLAFVAGINQRASAQAVDKAYAKSIVLAGNGTDVTNTITLTAPTLSPLSPYTLTLPTALPGSVGLALVSSSTTGGLTWSTSAPGTVTSVSGSGGTTGLTLTGGAITSSGTLTLGGTLIVGNGGTGLGTLTAHAIQVGAGTSNVTQLAVGGAGQILTGAASADPAWSSTPTLGVISSGGTPATGSIALANLSSANLTTIQGGNATAAVTYILPTAAPTSANQVLSANGTISPIQLSWGNGSQAFKNSSSANNITSTTLAVDPNLQITLAANATYQFSGVIAYDGNGAGGNTSATLNIAMHFTGTLTSLRWSAIQPGTAVSPSSVIADGTAISTFHVDPVTASNAQTIYVSGIIVVGATGGILEPEEALNTTSGGAGNTEILSNSFIQATRVQ
jgi:hypothetical protein